MGSVGVGIGGSSHPSRHGCGLSASIAITLAVAANGCGRQSSTTTGPTPVKCQLSLGTASSAVDAGGGSITVAVTTQSECAWTATTDVSWMTITSPLSGQGTASVDIRISLNPDATERRGVVTVNDHRLQIVQAAAKCQFTLAPASQTIAAGGGSGTIAVTAPSGCVWNVADVPGWIAITSAASGNGNGNVTFSLGSNSSAIPRTATLTIAGQPYLVTQQGAGCSYTIGRNAQTLPAAGGAGTPIAITATPGCTWTAISNVPWIAGVTPASGTDSGTVNFSVAVNPSGASRTGTLTVANQIFTVTQQGVGCSPMVSPTTLSIGAAGAPGTVGVTVATGCEWTAVSNNPSWITSVTPASGSGNGNVNFTVAANAGPGRSGALAVATQTVTVNQADGCRFTLTPPSPQTVPKAAGDYTVTVAASDPSCPRPAAVTATPWLTIISGGTSGMGGITLTFRVTANLLAQRSGTMSIAGQTYTVTQAPGP
jgi:hypothetical protein